MYTGHTMLSAIQPALTRIFLAGKFKRSRPLRFFLLRSTPIHHAVELVHQHI